MRDLFHKRMRRARGEVPDVYIYDKLPEPLKVQILHVCEKGFSIDFDSYHRLYKYVVDLLREELGVFQLINSHHFVEPQRELAKWFMENKNVEECISFIEILLRLLDYGIARAGWKEQQYRELVDRINIRFQEHGVGYRYESGSVIRVDSEYLHAEAVKNALNLLHNDVFAPA